MHTSARPLHALAFDRAASDRFFVRHRLAELRRESARRRRSIGPDGGRVYGTWLVPEAEPEPDTAIIVVDPAHPPPGN
jgi:hypothetical protein